MRTATEAFAQIAHQAAHVRAGAALDVQAQTIVRIFKQLETVYIDGARRSLHLLAATRALVQRHARLLQCRIDRWYLGNAAGQHGECVDDHDIVVP